MSGFLSGLSGEGGILRVRSLMTLGLVGGFVYGFIDEIVDADIFVQVVGIAVAFYFGSRQG